MASIGEADLQLQPLYDALVVMAVALTDEEPELRRTGEFTRRLLANSQLRGVPFSRSRC